MEETNEQTLSQAAVQTPPQVKEEETSNEATWEENHEHIIKTVRYLQDRRIKVSVSNICKLTKLSRPTVYKHLSEDSLNPTYKVYTQVNRLMMNDVLMRICEKAYNGDLKAARLYFELIGVIKTNSNTINSSVLNFNHAVMVKGQVLNEEMVENLSAENLSQLADFVKNASQSKTEGGLQNKK